MPRRLFSTEVLCAPCRRVQSPATSLPRRSARVLEKHLLLRHRHTIGGFDPSPDGPQVWETRHLRLGVGICWDQWFPEMARAMALKGAELLVYPTAIGSEPNFPDWDSAEQWQCAMRGHSASNLVPVLAANRVGVEVDDGYTLDFYGSSFCSNHRAAKIAEMGRTESGILMAELDLDQAAHDRDVWGVFQTRQPRNYGILADTPAGPPPTV